MFLDHRVHLWFIVCVITLTAFIRSFKQSGSITFILIRCEATAEIFFFIYLGEVFWLHSGPITAVVCTTEILWFVIPPQLCKNTMHFKILAKCVRSLFLPQILNRFSLINLLIVLFLVLSFWGCDQKGGNKQAFTTGSQQQSETRWADVQLKTHTH